jgi:hypothetical protein
MLVVVFRKFLGVRSRKAKLGGKVKFLMKFDMLNSMGSE